MRLLAYRFLLTVLIGLAVGCGAKPRIAPQFENTKMRVIAILPYHSSMDIPRERLAFIQNSFEAELKNAGFEVLEQQLVDSLCVTAECPRRSELFSRYLVDVIFDLKIDSIARNSFLAGYYNSIRGKLTIFDKHDTEIFTLKHVESERGGLIFNSGQIIQGLISQAKNGSVESRDALASNFARTLVEKIPRKEETRQSLDATAVALNRVETKMLRSQIYQICVDATPRSLASAIINRKKTTLRETAPGYYCGIYLLDKLNPAKPVEVEVRSPFGNPLRQEVALMSVPMCDSKNIAQVTASGAHTTLTLNCKAGEAEVRDNRFVIYRAPSLSGPFRKFREVTGVRWEEKLKESPSADVYAIVSVNSQGGRSLPHAVEPFRKGGM